MTHDCSIQLKLSWTGIMIPEGYAKLLSDWRQIWVVTNDHWDLTVQLACFQPYEQIIQAVV